MLGTEILTKKKVASLSDSSAACQILKKNNNKVGITLAL